MLRIWGAANVQAQLNVVSRKKVVYDIGGGSGAASTATAVPNSYEGRLSRANKSTIIKRTVRLRNSARAYIFFLYKVFCVQAVQQDTQ